jgi:hypothetical protein
VEWGHDLVLHNWLIAPQLSRVMTVSAVTALWGFFFFRSFHAVQVSKVVMAIALQKRTFTK